MPDHDPAPDPMEKAYVQAEAMLHDAAARAARRARVLGAVASEASAPSPAVPTPSHARRILRNGGWLAAASVAGLSALVAVQYDSPAVNRQAPVPAKPPIAVTPDASSDVAPEPAASASARPPQPSLTAPPVGPDREERREARSSLDAPVVVSPPLQAAPAPEAPVVSERRSERALETQSRAAPPSAARAAASDEAAMGSALPAAPTAMAARLRAAAAGGRTAELSALLARGAPVDAQDDEGVTALMTAIRANQPAAAALLVRHGADLDLRDHNGASARDLAAQIDDPELSEALDLGR